jgi:hypothetical protein
VGKIATIESGNELPPKKGRGVKSFGVSICLPDTIKALQDGQSFVVDEHSGRVRALQVGMKLGINLTSRRLAKKKGTPQYRIWRTDWL